MCGIVTIASTRALQEEEGSLKALAIAKSLAHRGPDGVRSWRSGDQHVAMAHARLSVIDLEGGWQPMVDPETGAAICYNGELYNFKEIRDELQGKGTRFLTQSDTEVILRAWLAWGEDCFKKFNGMFAVTIYVPKEKKLVIARDPVGIKPLYYYQTDATIYLASELRPLLIHRRETPQVSPVGIVQYLSQGYVMAPDTIVEGVFQFPHGSVGEWRNGTLKISRYRDFADDVNARRGESLTFAQVCEKTDQLIHQAVKRQLVSDVPVGCFLSGGVDSSLVASAAADAGADIPAFTMDFSLKEYSEASHASAVAKSIGLKQKLCHVDSDGLLSRWAEYAWRTDAPIFDNSFVPTHDLFAKARSDVTVALSGDGGDEVFLGYETYRADRVAAKMSHPLFRAARPVVSLMAALIPPRFGKVSFSYKIKAFSRAMRRDPAGAHCGWREILDRTTMEKIATPELEKIWDPCDPSSGYRSAWSRAHNGDPLTRLSYVDFETWLPGDILVKTDRASMAHGLEVRVPLLDIELVGFGLGLPDRYKMRGSQSKAPLRSLYEKRFPGLGDGGKKRGFNAPMSEWLAGSLGLEAQELLQQTDIISEYIDPTALNRLFLEHRTRKHDHGFFLWAAIVLKSWFHRLEIERASKSL